MHAFTVDLEEWFCTHNFQGVIAYADWDKLESRIERQVTDFLELLHRYEVKATFFVLGWVAARHPNLIRTLVREGHEVGSHGFSHQPTWQHSPESFRVDLALSTSLLTELLGVKPTAFRAPAFSITKQTAWAIEALQEAGYTTDSSVYPIGVHPEYGISDAALTPYHWPSGMREQPLSCVTYLGKRLPISGGAYFRFLPYAMYRRLVQRLEAQGRTLNFYLHPWEIDSRLPHVRGLAYSRYARHYTGLAQVKPKLERLLSDFQFGPLTHAFSC
jgi:polysaccharide deacetylase family protein (PEP-CTERM system associated)